MAFGAGGDTAKQLQWILTANDQTAAGFGSAMQGMTNMGNTADKVNVKGLAMGAAMVGAGMMIGKTLLG
jgi:hypothetical protein